MKHHIDDAHAARERNSARPATTWHPLLNTKEVHPGIWHVCAWDGTPYAIVRLIRIGPELGYRATTWHDDPSARRLIGYWRTLRTACARAHAWHVRQHGPNGFAPNPWPTSPVQGAAATRTA